MCQRAGGHFWTLITQVIITAMSKSNLFRSLLAITLINLPDLSHISQFVEDDEVEVYIKLVKNHTPQKTSQCQAWWKHIPGKTVVTSNGVAPPRRMEFHIDAPPWQERVSEKRKQLFCVESIFKVYLIHDSTDTNRRNSLPTVVDLVASSYTPDTWEKLWSGI